MDDHEPNPYESSLNRATSRARPIPSARHQTTLILLFELPAALLLVHGFAYLLDLPGAEVVVNEYGGMQPVALTFFRILATGGLLVPLGLGCWVAANQRLNVWMFGVCIGISYAAASVLWWVLTGMGVMMRFI